MNFYFSTNLDFENFPGVHFVQDHVGSRYSVPWNDFSYYVTFKLYYKNSGAAELLGYTKLLVRGFMDSSKYFITGPSLAGGTKYLLNSLLIPDNVVSLSSDIEFYEKVGAFLGAHELVDVFLQGICDGSYFYENHEEFRRWPGFDAALLRSGTISEASLKKGHQIALGRYVPDENFSIKIACLPETFETVDFCFSNAGDLGRQNINILIGRNGVGKTHVLRTLTEIVTGIENNAQSWPYFHKLIVVAYSPFENFYTKKSLLRKLYEVKQFSVKKDSQKKLERRMLNVNEYAYVGFRDESESFSLTWPCEHSVKSLLKILDYDQRNVSWKNSARFLELFKTLQMGMRFDAIGLSNIDGTFVYIDSENFLTIRIDENTVNKKRGISFFIGRQQVALSSGQLIYSYMLPCVVAEMESESLLVIDEPELYLHPTLEIGLIDMLKRLMEATASYAIIATHSAVMAREVKSEAVRILRKDGEKTIMTRAGFETFGESLDAISGEVFDDYHTRKPFQAAVDKVVKTKGNATEALASIGPHIGDEALAYLISLTPPHNEPIIFEDMQ